MVGWDNKCYLKQICLKQGISTHKTYKYGSLRTACVQSSKKILKSLLMIRRVAETGGCMGEWNKLVDAQESGRNLWMHGRVNETGGCMGE
jgi:hypothetical protein